MIFFFFSSSVNFLKKYTFANSIDHCDDSIQLEPKS